MKPVRLQPDPMSNSMTEAVEAFFRQEVTVALANNPRGAITGRVVDGAGNPIEGAMVKADLNLTLLSLATPARYYLSPYRNPPERFTVTTGRDGRFALIAIVPGNLLVEGCRRRQGARRFAGDNRLRSEAGHRRPVLDQGDSIFGMVQDEQGRPLPGASIIPTTRQYSQNKQRVYDGIVTQAGPK